MDAGRFYDLEALDTHSIGGLMKLYVRSLPECMLTHALYDAWLSAAGK